MNPNDNNENRERRVRLDDLGDKTLWELGGERPILEIKALHSKLNRRNALEKVIRGALLTVGGFALV